MLAAAADRGVLLLYAYRDDVFGPSLGHARSASDGRRADGPGLAVRARRRALRWARCSSAGWTRGPRAPSGFLIRLTTILVAFLVAARIAGLDPRTLAVGGAFTAVVVGLAAQQTLGNLIAGTVLLSARPFRVGDRVRFQGGGLAGNGRGRRRLARAALHDARRAATT